MKNNKNGINTYQLTIDAMLAAMVALLGYISIDATVFKVTFESLPILIGSFLLGPLDGMLVGGIGTLIYQLLRYGFSYTTVLWMLPYILAGLMCGLIAKKHKFELSRKTILITTLIAELIISVLNTGVIYLDSKINHYYYAGIILGSLALRLGIAVAKGLVFGAVLPYFLAAIKKIKQK
ncbi:MAG: ECF transporter S component [Oscillospiraceae bacterium]|nr:ECF transporter S component [Candidatus Limimonas coprohippi]